MSDCNCSPYVNEVGTWHSPSCPATQLNQQLRLTELERAVVEAAVAYREAQNQVWVQSEVGTEQKVEAAEAARLAAEVKLTVTSEELRLARKQVQVETN